MNSLDLVGLPEVMQRTQGQPGVSVGLIDGPINTSHPEFSAYRIQDLSTKSKGVCRESATAACIHGTMVTGVLFARRASAAPAICPNCTLIIRPIFDEGDVHNGGPPTANPDDLAQAIVETVNAGAHVINLSCGMLRCPPGGEERINAALTFAANRGTIVVVAAGNQSSIGGSCITRHPWVIPVAGCDSRGLPTDESNLSASIGRRGLMAPGQDVTTLGMGSAFASFGGTSAACPFVTGAIALLRSVYPRLCAGHIKTAIASEPRRGSIVPPLLNAWDAFQRLETAVKGSRVA